MRKIMSYGSGGDGGSTSERAAEKKLLQVRRLRLYHWVPASRHMVLSCCKPRFRSTASVAVEDEAASTFRVPRLGCSYLFLLADALQ